VAGTWRSLVAHLTGGQGVAGSNPVVPTVKTAGQRRCPSRLGTASEPCDDSSDDNVALAAALVVIVEQDIELAQGVLLDPLDDIDVGACGDGDGAVPEDPLHGRGLDALGEEQGCAGVPEIMKAYWS
jgi:hypothetical protein